MEDSQVVVYALLAGLLTVYLFKWRFGPLSAIPTVGGPSAPLFSLWTAWNMKHNAREILTEGYKKFHGTTFKSKVNERWMVFVNGPRLVEQLRNSPENELSLHESMDYFFQMRLCIGAEIIDDLSNTDIIKEKLTRSLPVVLPEVIDELTQAIPEYIPTNDDEWTAVHAMSTLRDIIARASNRVFVGVPACRNEEYLRLSVEYAVILGQQKPILRMFPKFFKRILRLFVTEAEHIAREVETILKPMIDERRARLQQHRQGEHGKPNDMLQWCMEYNPDRSDNLLAKQMLQLNFVAIHTSSLTLTHALYHLAAAPEYVGTLRDEVESLVAAEGWTKAAMGKMWKLDSFLKESMRFNGLGLVNIARKALKDVTLCDGTFIPAGTFVVTAIYPLHRDETRYAAPDDFDPFRFSRLREGEGEGVKHQFVNTSNEYLVFGHGRRACPGRFFAANELKATLAYMVLHYDMKLDGDGGRPENIYDNFSVLPNPYGKVMFRKRQT